MKLDSLQKLFVEQLQDLYSAEKQLVQALPKMAKAASSPQLQQGFTTHLEQTKGHAERLEKMFKTLGSTHGSKKCKAMEGLIAEGQEMMQEDATPEVMDAGLIAAAQRVEHYEIAGYGTVRAYARMLGQQEALRLIEQTLEEEKQTDEKLTQLAESTINVQADTGDNSTASVGKSRK